MKKPRFQLETYLSQQSWEDREQTREIVEDEVRRFLTEMPFEDIVDWSEEDHA